MIQTELIQILQHAEAQAKQGKCYYPELVKKLKCTFFKGANLKATNLNPETYFENVKDSIIKALTTIETSVQDLLVNLHNQQSYSMFIAAGSYLLDISRYLGIIPNTLTTGNNLQVQKIVNDLNYFVAYLMQAEIIESPHQQKRLFLYLAKFPEQVRILCSAFIKHTEENTQLEITQLPLFNENYER